MVRLLVRHPVQDFDAFKEGYDAAEQVAIRNDAGVTYDALFTTIEDRYDVLVVHDFGSREAAEAFLARADLQEPMGKLGVAGEPKIQLFDPQERSA